jgi:hypothetical protein
MGQGFQTGCLRCLEGGGAGRGGGVALSDESGRRAPEQNVTMRRHHTCTKTASCLDIICVFLASPRSSLMHISRLLLRKSPSIFLLLTAATPLLAQGGTSLPQLVERAQPAVVSLQVFDESGIQIGQGLAGPDMVEYVRGRW